MLPTVRSADCLCSVSRTQPFFGVRLTEQSAGRMKSHFTAG